ncbi:MAG: hypothetical protein WC867_04680 [Candidatus Pacearchaeota archaeon]|jgi:hypothetical protein
MKVIGFNFSKILVERKEGFPDKLQISQNINIKDITKEKLPISNDEALKLDFNFVIDYTGNFAKLEFEGHVMLLPEKEEMKSFMKEWKDKKLPEQDRIQIFNFIMNKCNVKALTLEDDIGLPLHIPLPRVNSEKQ